MSIDNVIEASQTNDAHKSNLLVAELDEAFDSAEEIEAPEPEPAPEPEDEHVSEDLEPEPELEASEPEPEAEEIEPPPNLSAKANERFRKLANEKKAAEERSAALELKFEQLLEHMGRSAEIQNEQLQFNRRLQEDQYRAQEPEILRRQMMAAGLDPADPRDRDRFQHAVALEELKLELENLKKERAEQSDSLAMNNYFSTAEKVLRGELKGYDIDDDTFEEIVRETVIEGNVQRLAATKAAKNKATRLKRLARKKALKKPTGEQKRVIEAVSSSGRTGGKSPKSSQSKGKGFGDLVNEFFGH